MAAYSLGDVPRLWGRKHPARQLADQCHRAGDDAPRPPAPWKKPVFCLCVCLLVVFFDLFVCLFVCLIDFCLTCLVVCLFVCLLFVCCLFGWLVS